MNILEIILEQIESLHDPYYKDYVDRKQVIEIIRSHMNNTAVRHDADRRLIDADVLDEEVRNFFLAITGNPKQATVVRECKESFRRMVDEQPTVPVFSDWVDFHKERPGEDMNHRYAWVVTKGPRQLHVELVKCIWVNSEDGVGEDNSFIEFKIPYPYGYRTVSADTVQYWMPIDVPEFKEGQL